MPTRIVLNKTVATAAPPGATWSKTVSSRYRTGNYSSPSNNNITNNIGSDVEAGRRSILSSPTNGDHSNPVSSPLANNKVHPGTPRSSRKIVSLRSSLFQGIKDERNTIRTLSSEDIRASPRLLGYLFQLLASTVMLISVLKFYFEDDGKVPPEIWDLFKNKGGNSFRKELFYTISGPLFTWKLIGCFVVSGVGTAVNLAIILVHFDTICIPSFWLKIFRDGSRYEQIIVLLMALFWGGGLHINTSPLSVGESQANVYFTSWISFVSSVLNCGVWRVSAGRVSLAELANNHHRLTTFNWIWLLFFAVTCAGAMCATYANRDYVKLFFRGEVINVSQREWLLAISTLWGLAVVCIVALLLNHFLKKSCEFRVCGGSIVLLGWRQAEGLIALAMAGFYFWFVFTYTGVNGFINGLSNLYFGLWGAFINSVLLLATWLRENKSIDFIKKEEEEREEQMMERMRWQ